jgi:hypothetical protein
MGQKLGRKVGYQTMVILAVVVGLFGIAIQFFQGWELLSFMLTIAVLGGLIGGSKDYNERDRLTLDRSYKTAIEWLLLIILAAYAFIELSRWLPIEESVAFLDGHWPGFFIAVMCLLMGIAGLRKRSA